MAMYASIKDMQFIGQVIVERRHTYRLDGLETFSPPVLKGIF
jgi:hypothetical protein